MKTFTKIKTIVSARSSYRMDFALNLSESAEAAFTTASGTFAVMCWVTASAKFPNNN
jgi:hypothetical protein